MEDREVKEQQPVSRRKFLIGGAATLAAAALAACGIETKSKTEPGPQLPTAPPTREQTTRPGPGPSPAPSPGTQPPTGEGAPAPQPTAEVIAAITVAAGVKTPEPGQTPPTVTAAPTPRPTPAETATPRPPEPPKPAELPPLSVPTFDVDNKFMMDLTYGAGGGAVDLRSPTADTGGTVAELPGDPREYAARMFGIADREFFVKDPVGRMLYGMSIAVQAGFPERGPTTYPPFEPEELRYWTSKLDAPQGIQVEMMTINRETVTKTINHGADIGVAGMIEDQGKRWFVVFYDNYKEADEKKTPKGYLGLVPQEAFEKLTPLAGIDYDEAADGTLTFKFQDSTGRRRTWVPNAIKDDYRDSILQWMEEREGPPAPETVEWPIERIIEEQERTGKILAFWVPAGGRVEEAIRTKDGQSALLVTEITGGTEILPPINGEITKQTGTDTRIKLVNIAVTSQKTLVVAFSPATNILIPDGSLAEIDKPLARVSNALMSLDTFSIFSKQAQIIVGAYNPETYQVLSIGLSDILKDDQGRIVVIAQ